MSGCNFQWILPVTGSEQVVTCETVGSHHIHTVEVESKTPSGEKVTVVMTCFAETTAKPAPKPNWSLASPPADSNAKPRRTRQGGKPNRGYGNRVLNKPGEPPKCYKCFQHKWLTYATGEEEKSWECSTESCKKFVPLSFTPR